MSKGDIDQFWKYLMGSKYKPGFLINFSPNGLQIKTRVYDTARNKQNPHNPPPRNIRV